jgi:hypothetical protein
VLVVVGPGTGLGLGIVVGCPTEVISVVHGPAWPKAWGFGPALRGFGLRKIQAGPYILALAWLQPGLA